ncbi:MAG TPA: AAA family ATPase [Gaiellaceae bacterium]
MGGAAATGPLLERSEELTRIESALSDARAGHGRFVVVEGPAGIGKTVLLAAAREAAADAGMRVLRSRGTELEREFAFGVVRQLFELELAERSELERAEVLHDAAGEAASLLGLPGARTVTEPDGHGVDPSFAILHGLYWLAANLAADDPLCLVVDDAHWADTASLRYLAFLVTRLEELEAALVLATRTGEAEAQAAGDGLVATLTADPSATVVRLRGLTAGAVGELVRSKLDEAPDPRFVDACLRMTQGTPFLLGQLLDALHEEQVAPTGEAVPEVERLAALTVGGSLSVRLARLPPHAGQLARALAVLEQSDLLDAARLAGLNDVEAADAAGLLATAGIVESARPLAFVHPIVRSGIYSELPPRERARSHRRAAELLARTPGARKGIAEHLLLTEPANDEWVVERLVDAASVAIRRGAPEAAATFLRRALAEPPPGDLFELLLEVGAVEASAGLDGWAEHLQAAVEAAPDAAATVLAARVLASALNRNQRHAEAVGVLDRAGSALEPVEDALALHLEAAAVVDALNDPATAASMAFRAAALRDRARADPEAPPDVLAAAAFSSVLANEPASVGAELAARALAVLEDTSNRAEAPWPSAAFFARTALSLLWTERYARVRPVLDDSIAQARLTGDSGRLAVGLGGRCWLALRRGDPRAAEADARTALAASELPAPPLYRVLNGGLLVEALVEQGELEAAERALAFVDGEAQGASLTAVVLRFARGRLRFEQGRAGEALEDFTAVGARLSAGLVSCPSFLPWRSAAALAQLALGDSDATRLSQEELGLAEAFGAERALGVARRVCGLVTGGDRGERLLREAIESFKRGDAALERARALADLGASLRRRNRRTEARELLREALDLAHRLGAGRLAGYAETELRATGARPRRIVLTGLDSLTASERRIAELASQDLTNREIAQTLFITSRTVEGHLTSVFRKLRLDSRRELATALAEEAPVSA